MKKVLWSLFTAMAILVVSCWTGRAQADEVYAHQYGTPASTQSPWDYRLLPTHGLKECGFSVPTDADAGVNGGVLSGTAPNVQVAAQEGHPVRLVLICRRAYFTDRQGHLWVGPEVVYSGPGQVEIIGQEWPSDPTVRGHHPRGRMWTVPAGLAGTEATYTLRGGGDVLNVTIVPFRAPATVKDVAYYVEPTAKRAEEAYQAATTTPSWKRRIFQLTANYALKLNSFGTSSAVPTAPNHTADATQGWGLGLNLLLGEDEQWRFLVGVDYAHLIRQKGVINAPNAPTNGFNSFADWQTHMIAGKVGVEVMPVRHVELQLWGALGPMISVDGNIPVSQLPDKTVFSDQADTTVALAGAVGFNLNFVVAQHLVLGPGLKVGGNLSKMPLARGQERICASGNECLVRKDGHIVDVVFTPINIGVMF